jgi:hypothetical protein
VLHPVLLIIIFFLHQQRIAVGNIHRQLISIARHHLEKDIAHHLLPGMVIRHHLEKDIAHHLHPGKVIHRHLAKDIIRNKVRAIHPLVGNALYLPPINNKFYLNYQHEYEKQFFHFFGLDYSFFGL